MVCAFLLALAAACSAPPVTATLGSTATGAAAVAVSATPSPMPTTVLAPVSPTRSFTTTPVPAPATPERSATPVPASRTPETTIRPSPTHTPLPTGTPTPRNANVPIGNVDAGRVGEVVTVTGQVMDAASFSEGFTFTLDDGSGQIVLLTWLDTYDGIIAREGLGIGATVQVGGKIDRYENALQIVAARATDVVILTPGSRQGKIRETGSITADDVDDRVSVEGQVAGVEAFSSGTRIFLDDGSGRAMVLMWRSVLERVPGAAGEPSVGSWLRAIGKVSEYEGTLEIVPALPFDLESVPVPADHPVEAPVTGSTLTPIGELSAERLGEVVTVSGQVVGTASFSKGFKFTLDDSSGQINLLMWHNVYDDYAACQDASRLNVGAEVRVTGEISAFEGALQIEPGSCHDIEVIASGGSSALKLQISAIGDHQGQRVGITGQITRVEDSDYGARLFVGDDTGEALVFVWQNVLERVPGRHALREAGARVSIAGLVQTYRGELEIVPALPYDVMVLD